VDEPADGAVPDDQVAGVDGARLVSVLDGDTGFRIMRTEPVDEPGILDVEAEPIWAIEPTSP
jgi:hypothetical protein